MSVFFISSSTTRSGQDEARVTPQRVSPHLDPASAASPQRPDPSSHHTVRFVSQHGMKCRLGHTTSIPVENFQTTKISSTSIVSLTQITPEACPIVAGVARYRLIRRFRARMLVEWAGRCHPKRRYQQLCDRRAGAHAMPSGKVMARAGPVRPDGMGHRHVAAQHHDAVPVCGAGFRAPGPLVSFAGRWALATVGSAIRCHLS